MTKHQGIIYEMAGMKHQNLHWPSIQHISGPLLNTLPFLYWKSHLLLHIVDIWNHHCYGFTKASWPEQWKISPCFWLITSTAVVNVFNAFHSNDQSMLLMFALFPHFFTSLNENQNLNFWGHLLQPLGWWLELSDQTNLLHLLCSLDLLHCVYSVTWHHLCPKPFFSLYISSHFFLSSSYTAVHAKWNGYPPRQSSHLNKSYKIDIWQVLLKNNRFFEILH